MQEHANPIEFLIDFAWSNGADKFIVNNAKDELKRMRTLLDNNQYQITCWARINEHGDIYDPRLSFNPYVDQNTVLPLYSNIEEFKQLMKNMAP